MKKNNNKIILLLIITIIFIFVFCCILFVKKTVYLNNNNSYNVKEDKNDLSNGNNSVKEDLNDNNSVKEDLNDLSNDDRCMQEITKVDVSIPYKSTITDNAIDIGAFTKIYSSATLYEFTTSYCISPETTFAFEIKDGILSLSNKNTGKVSYLDGINNFKNLVYVKLFTSFYSYKLYLLTDDGKVYQSIISPEAYIFDTDNINKIFQLIELPVKIKEIGIIKTPNIPATSEELLLKDENGIEYYGEANKFYKIS